MDNLYSHLPTANPKDGWVILGPGGGGCVHTLTISPHRPQTMLVSCDMTAGYITHNDGLSWRQFNLKSRQYAYAFDPQNPDTIYVGTSGLFRSTDNGATWQLVFPDPKMVIGESRLGDEANHTFTTQDNWPGRTIHAILIDPLCPDHLFIVIKKQGPRQPSDDFYNRKKEGLLIFASTDHGGQWHPLGQLDCTDIHLLAFDPTTPVNARVLLAITEKGFTRITPSGDQQAIPLPEDVVTLRHASCGLNPATRQTIFFLSAVVKNSPNQSTCTILRTSDLGVTWHRPSAGLEAGIPGETPIISQVSACASDARRVWLIAEKFPDLDGSGQRVDRHGILRSDDSGDTWHWAVKMDDDHDPTNRTGGWAERDYGAQHGDLKGDDQISPKGRFAWDVVASPVDPETCYTMDFSTIFKTSDGGTSWEQLVTHVYPDGSVSSRGIDVLGPYGVFFDPFDPQHIVLTMTDVGIFHSHNRGRTWLHSLQGVPRHWINTCYWMTFDPAVPGRAWSAWSAMHDIPRLKSYQENLLQSHQGGLCRSDDHLKTWQPCASGLPENAKCTHLLLDPASPAGQRTLYVAVFNSGFYRSVDDGLTWKPKNQGLEPRNPFAWRLALLEDGTLFLVVVKNRLRGSEMPGAVYRSTDHAETWQPLALPAGVDFPNDLVSDPSGRLYLACWPHAKAGGNHGGGAYASDDRGATWVQIFDPTAHVYSLAVDPTNPSTLYLTTFDAGVHRSDDRGKTWRRLKGFNFQWAYRPIVDPVHPGMLYVTAFGSSVWLGPAEGVPDANEDMTPV